MVRIARGPETIAAAQHVVARVSHRGAAADSSTDHRWLRRRWMQRPSWVVAELGGGDGMSKMASKILVEIGMSSAAATETFENRYGLFT
eukprot:5614961-Prymnesium_polylepis.1